jgi:two-component sensor histidine kinase/CHASE2 domain-containing sensor protein
MRGSTALPDAMKQLDARARVRVSYAGLAAALVAALLVAAFGSGPRQSLIDLYQNIIPSPAPSRLVHVVVLDAESLREVGGWPWSRFYLARLVEQIADRGASVIGLDILLPEPDRMDPGQFASLYPELRPDEAADIRRLPSMDAVLARVVGRSPVVLARAGVRPGSFDSLEHVAAPRPPEARFVGQPPRGMLDFPTVVANLPVLDDAALGQGLVNGDHDPDGVVRRVPLVARAGGELTPGFALELVRVAEGAPRIELEGPRGFLKAVRVGRRRVAATPDGQLILRFGDWRRIQTTSAVNLLRRGMPKDLFKGQIVLVGLTSAGSTGIASTPRAGAIPGVFIQAQAVDGILRGAGLYRPGWARPTEWILGLLLAAVACAELAAAFGGGALAFQHNQIIDPFPVLAPAAATAATMFVLLFVEGRRLQARLQATLEQERREAAEHQLLLINELNHRVKNTLATVQSIAGQSFRPDRSLIEAHETFISRLIALSSAQNLLTAEGWEGADLFDIVRMAVAPFEEPPLARFRISGAGARLEAQHALAIAMALHELCVNAVKFGALSQVGGQIGITWKRVDGEVRFVWQEKGGPLVQPPVRKGFGTRLIQDALARELGGQVRIEHRPTASAARSTSRRRRSTKSERRRSTAASALTEDHLNASVSRLIDVVGGVDPKLPLAAAGHPGVLNRQTLLDQGGADFDRPLKGQLVV